MRRIETTNRDQLVAIPKEKRASDSLFLVSGLCVIAFCLYLPSLHAQFIHDDNPQIVKNPQIKSWDYLPRPLTSDVWSQKGSDHTAHFYRPFFSVWMLLVYSLGGLSTWFWHFSSVVLHVAVTCLVFNFIGTFLRSSAAAFGWRDLFCGAPKPHREKSRQASSTLQPALAIFR